MTITLDLSPDVQRKLETLATRNGQDIESVANTLFQQAVESVDRNSSAEVQAFPPNEKMLAILRGIEESHKGRPSTSGVDTDRLLREARSGAMFGYDPTSNLLPGAVVIDANVVIAICAKEVRKELLALTELAMYSSRGYQFYAPGLLISEALYVLCGQEQGRNPFIRRFCPRYYGIRDSHQRHVAAAPRRHGVGTTRRSDPNRLWMQPCWPIASISRSPRN